MTKRAEAILGQAFTKNAVKGDVFSKLARYETAIERSILRWLHELRRVQDIRSGQAADTVVAGEAILHESPEARRELLTQKIFDAARNLWSVSHLTGISPTSGPAGKNGGAKGHRYQI